MKTNIKKYSDFLNENNDDIIENIILQLDKLGIEYELSNNQYQPFKVIYKPKNKPDEFYDKFDDIIYLNNLESVVKNV